MIGWLIWGVLILIAGLWLIAAVGRAVGAAQGHARCAYCRSRLKSVGGTYATTCRRCGRAQPWAKVPATVR